MADATRDALRFTPEMLAKPTPTRFSVETTLEHFAIVTYLVDPTLLKRHLHPRFEPYRVCAEDGSLRGLVSVVTFLDQDFRFVGWPWLKRSFGQTNYRAYVTDKQTGEHVAWFFGTCVDSVTVAIPRYLWKLPWHRGRVAFDCRYDEADQRYGSYRVSTRSRWAPAALEIEDTGTRPAEFPGFSSVETGLVVLTHPLRGYFFRRDGSLGSYAIWHDRMHATVGRVTRARYPLFTELGLVPEGDRRNIHSVLLQRRFDFTIYLPPTTVPE